MTISLKSRVLDLLPELLTHTLVLLFSLGSAGAVSARLLKSLFYRPDNFLIRIQHNFNLPAPPESGFPLLYDAILTEKTAKDCDQVSFQSFFTI